MMACMPPRFWIGLIFFFAVVVLPKVAQAISESKKSAARKRALDRIDELRRFGRDDEANAIARIAGVQVPEKPKQTMLDEGEGAVWTPSAPSAGAESLPQGSVRAARMQQIEERKARRDEEMAKLRELARARAADAAGASIAFTAQPVSPSQPTPAPSQPQAQPGLHPAVARIRAALEVKRQQELQSSKPAHRAVQTRQEPVQEEITLIERERRREKVEQQRINRERAQARASQQSARNDHVHQQGEDLREHHLKAFDSTLGPDGYTSDAPRFEGVSSARARLGIGTDARSLRRAFLFSELMGKPIGLRGDGDANGF